MMKTDWIATREYLQVLSFQQAFSYVSLVYDSVPCSILRISTNREAIEAPHYDDHGQIKYSIVVPHPFVNYVKGELMALAY